MGFVVEKREGRSHFWSEVTRVGAKVTSYVINNLQHNCTYYIRVAAENEEGVGKFREITEPVKPMKPKSEYIILSGPIKAERYTFTSLVMVYSTHFH